MIESARGWIRARVVRKVVKARGIGGVCAQFLPRKHKFVDAVQLRTPLTAAIGAAGNRLVTEGKMRQR